MKSPLLLVIVWWLYLVVGGSHAKSIKSSSVSFTHHHRPSSSPTTITSSDQNLLPSTDHVVVVESDELFRQAAIVGVITAAMGHIYGIILDKTVEGVWKKIPNFIINHNIAKLGPRYIFYTMSIGGLIMGILSMKLQPTYAVADFVLALSGSGSDGCKASLLPELMPALTNLLLLSLVTSTFGFSVGPEAPMVCAGGLIGKALSQHWYQEPAINKHLEQYSHKKAREIMIYAGAAGALTAFMGTPLAGSVFVLELTLASSGMNSMAKDALVPAVVASAVALVIIRGVLAPHSSIGGHFSYPTVGKLSGRAAIVTSLICGAGGALIGTFFHKIVHALKDVLWIEKSSSSDTEKGKKKKKIPREILVKTAIGVAVGLLSMKYPSTMFWGEGSLQTAIDGQSTPFSDTKHGLADILTSGASVDTNVPFQSAWTAAQVGIAKLIAISLACGGKFPGGIIFPLFFAAAPIAHATLKVFSSYLPEAVGPVAVMALMASTQSSVTRTPLATVFMLALSTSSGTELSKLLPSVILSSYIGVWFTRYLSKESYFTYSK